MGCMDIAESSPVHEVYLDRFHISKYEVTIEEYLSYLNETQTKYAWANAEDWPIKGTPGNYHAQKKHLKLPVTGIKWPEAIAYCKWLSKKSGRRITLPTIAQWEKAAKGGNRSRQYLYSGSNIPDRIGWWEDNSGKRCHPVGQKLPNELGLYDMSGNVFEWCLDWWSLTPYNKKPKINPTGPKRGKFKAYRGGSWKHILSYLRPSHRNNGGIPKIYRSPYLGFRLAMID